MVENKTQKQLNKLKKQNKTKPLIDSSSREESWRPLADWNWSKKNLRWDDVVTSWSLWLLSSFWGSWRSGLSLCWIGSPLSLVLLLRRRFFVFFFLGFVLLLTWVAFGTRSFRLWSGFLKEGLEWFSGFLLAMFVFCYASSLLAATAEY